MRENMMRSVQALWGNGHVYVYCNCDEEGKFLYHRDKTRTDLEHHLNGNDVHLMQFTGLTDKNGKEIFEGDIVKRVFDAIVPQYVICEVTWREKYAGFNLTHRILKNYNNPGEGWSLSTHEGWEVIGNIHEDAALLEPQSRTS